MAYYSEPSILYEINTFTDCEVALFTTFNFDISFFDRAIMASIFKRCKRTCLFVDSGKLQEAINERDINLSYIGNIYFVQPFVINGAFHPKLILLLGKNKAKVIVSSANLTSSSHFSNHEVFQSYTYTEEDKEYLGLVKTAFSFFASLNKVSNKTTKVPYIDNEILGYALNNFGYLSEEETKTTTTLITNISEPILNQVTRIVPKDDVKEIRVAVPFYDKELSALSEFKKAYPNAKVTLYLQTNYTTFPKDKYLPSLIEKVNIFDKVNNNTHASYRFYHGKVFNFISDSKEYILFGSANFSSSALLQTHITHGNVEADILDEGERGSFDALFESFKLETKTSITELNTRVAENNSIQASPITFMKGTIENEYVSVLLKSSIDLSSCTISIEKIGDITVKNVGAELYLIRFKNKLENKQTVFDITIVDEKDNTHTVRCFVSNIDQLNSNLKIAFKNPFKNKFNTEEDIEKYNIETFLAQFPKVAEDIRAYIHGGTEDKDPTTKDVIDDTVEGETDQETEIDSSMEDEEDKMIVIGDPEIYSDVLAFLKYYTKKTEGIFTRGRGTHNPGTPKAPNPPKEPKPGDETEEENNTTNRGSQRFYNKVLSYFEDYAKKENTEIDKLDFTVYYGIYEMFMNLFITEKYLIKKYEINMRRLVEGKINYFINRIVPTIIDPAVQKSDEFNYFKEELALLCLECYNLDQEMPDLIDMFKHELFMLDKLFNYELINEIEALMLEVGKTLEITDTVNRQTYFKNFIINSPKDEELLAYLINHFELAPTTPSISFDKESLHLEITIDGQCSGNKQIIDNETVNKILSYINRFHSDYKKEEKEEDKVPEIRNESISFTITINNFNVNIPKVSFDWNSRDYRHYRVDRTYKTGYHPNPDTYELQ